MSTKKNNIAGEDFLPLRSDGDLQGKEKQLITRETIKATGSSLGDLRAHFEVSENTQTKLGDFVSSDIAPRVKPEYVKAINTHFGFPSQKFTLDSFYATLSIQKKFIALTQDNPLEVYKHFGSEFPKVTLDGIPGPMTMKALAYLKKIDTVKKQYLEAQIGIPKQSKNIGEFFIATLNRGIKKYAEKLKSNSGVELSSQALYEDIKSILTEIKTDLKNSRNIFASDVDAFIKNFLADEEKAVQIIKYFINQFINKPNSEEVQMKVVYDIYASSLTFITDVAISSNPEQLQLKIQEIKNFPMIAQFLESNPDFETLFNLFPEMARFIDTDDQHLIGDFFKDIRQGIIDISLGKGNPEELEKKANDIFQKLLYLLTDILGRFDGDKQDKKKEFKELFKKILSLSIFDDAKSSPLFRLVQNSLENEEVDSVKISLKFLELAQASLRSKKKFKEIPGVLEIIEKLFDEKDRAKALDAIAQKVEITMVAYDFIKEAEANFSRLSPEKQKEVSQILKELLPKQTGEEGFASKLQNAVIKKALDLYTTVENESLKSAFTFLVNTGGSIFSGTMVDKINTVFSGNTNFLKISFPKDAQVSRELVETFKSKVAILIKDTLKKEGRLTKSQLVLKIKETIKDVAKKTGDQDLGKIFQVLEGNPFLIETITQAVLDDLSKREDVGVYLIQNAQEKDEKHIFLSRLNMLADGLYTILEQKKEKVDIQKLFEDIMKQYGFEKLKGYKILGKPILESLLVLVRGMKRSDFKIFLFENAGTIQELLSGNMQDQVKIERAIQLAFKAIKKSPNAKLTQYQKEMLEFMRTAEISEQIPPQENSRVIAETITLGGDTFSLYSKKIKQGRNFHIGPRERETVMFFSDKIFDMIYALVSRYGQGGLDMVNSGQIYENKFDSGDKKAFFDALKGSFKENSKQIAKGQKFSLLIELISNLFSRGKLEISEKTQEDLVLKYFSSRQNKADFRNVVLGVFA